MIQRAARLSAGLLSFLALLVPGTALAAAGPPVSIRGQILGPDGRPVAGAEVRLLAPVSLHEVARRLLAGETARPATRSVRSDADGRFVLTTEPGVYDLEVEAPGLAPRRLVLGGVVEETAAPPLRMPR